MSYLHAHRGTHPEDARLFAPTGLERLRRAAEEVAYLLGRGWSVESAVGAVGGHHQLETRQRVALGRAACSDAQLARRGAHALGRAEVAGQNLSVDGFNLIIHLEAALGGGVLIEGRDGTLRDLQGLRGSYRPVAETDAALALIGEMLAALRPAAACVYLERAVASSGRLRGLIGEHALGWQIPTEVVLCADADPLLMKLPAVVSSDARILDACESWVNLARWIVDERVPGAWRVPLFGLKAIW